MKKVPVFSAKGGQKVCRLKYSTLPYVRTRALLRCLASSSSSIYGMLCLSLMFKSRLRETGVKITTFSTNAIQQ